MSAAPVSGTVPAAKKAPATMMEVTVGDRRVRYATPNETTRYRVRTLFTKEPDTLSWIAGMDADDVLYDVGANVGMYAIWAAATRDVRVAAFEPEAQNFALLNTNIRANGLQEKVTAWPLALADETRLDLLHLGDAEAGGSCNSFGESVDYHLRPATFPLRQGAVAFRLDDIVASGAVARPTHLKIDVDGFEHRVVAGAAATLADRRLRSVLVEINSDLDSHRALVARMEEWGFGYDTGQVAKSRRETGPFAGIGNYVFRRA